MRTGSLAGNQERGTAREDTSIEVLQGQRLIAPIRAEIFAIVFTTGAVVLLVEILGTRIVGPVFGVDLFVWSALLAATLGSLASGYYAGGSLVDRRPTPWLLGLVVMTAGVLLGILRLISHGVLLFSDGFGPRAGPLLAATVLFAPCLIVLGMVGPIAVRLLAVDLRAAGHGVGAVYAVSTAGSLAGTLVTAFAIIPAFDTDQVVVGAATLLTLMGAASLALHGRPSGLVAVAVPLLLAWAAPESRLPAGFERVARSQSLYGLVEVIDDHARNVRFLRSDHSVLGAQFVRDGSPGFAFVYVMEAVRFLRPAARDMLQIGLGIGSLPSALEARGIKVDVVEIDPAVVRFASRYFGFASKGNVYQEDARTFLRRTDRHYDLIVHDTFTGGTTPEHLLSREVMQRIHDLLRPGGVMVLNFVGYEDGPNAEATWDVARTVRSAFRFVRTFRDSEPDLRPHALENLVFFASDNDLDLTVPRTAAFENATSERVTRSLPAWEVLKVIPDGPLVTDGHNPLARLQLPVAEEHFAAMNVLLPVGVWIE
jgi:SAM-dependent methyltransferase